MTKSEALKEMTQKYEENTFKLYRARAIKSRFVLDGLTIHDVAVAIGVSRFWVSAVINGRANSKKVKKDICSILKVEYENLWKDKIVFPKVKIRLGDE